MRCINSESETNRESKICQVWVCVVPREEAVLRIIDRDGRTREEAERRGSSQLSNAGGQKQSNFQSTIKFKCRAGFMGKHRALHPLGARSYSEAGGGGSGEVPGGDEHQWDKQLVELC